MKAYRCLRRCSQARPIRGALSCLLLSVLLPFAARGDALLGMEPIPDILPWFDRGSDVITNARERTVERPVELLLSRSVYPAHDGHIDGVLWLDAAPGNAVDGYLVIRGIDAEGREWARSRVDDIPDSRLFFSFAFPEALAGRSGLIEAAWTRGVADGEGEAPVSVRARFDVAEPVAVKSVGRVRIDVPNDRGATLDGLPVSVGVPFPRGALQDPGHLRLTDASGAVVPMQAEPLGRWSRFGSFRWVRCSFTARVEGGPAVYYLEYGPDVQGPEAGPSLAVSGPATAGIPAIEAGPLSIRPTGLWFDAAGNGSYRRVLAPEALRGGYVEHEDGRVLRMAPDLTAALEETGPERVVLRTEGYFRADDGTEFCRYVTRFFVHRASPVLRILHTWIFTGDGNRDRIANMGWRFDLDPDLAPDGFLTSAGDSDEWMSGDFLLQHDHNRFVVRSGADAVREGARAPGIATAAGPNARVTFAVRDFWQNFPSELEFADGAFFFHMWPRHGRPAEHRPATVEDAIRLWFVHEGEMLDFRLPEEFLSGPIYQEATRGIGYEQHWDEGDAASANAQGIARTEEMWLYVTAPDVPRAAAAPAARGLEEQTLAGIVDPVWMAASGAFGPVHHRDPEAFPAHERVFAEVARAPYRWVDRVGIYGMWIYGDNLWNPYLEERSAQLYRAFRKSHHRWPYSWIPFVRSGEPEFLRYAHAATRQMYDANFCHYVSEEVAMAVRPPRVRRRGIWHQSLVPWTGRSRGPATRNYSSQMDYLWHAWHVGGDPRARDVAALWQEEVKVEESLAGRDGIPRSARVSTAALHAFVDTYEATFDPWFLVAAHALAERDMENHREGRLQPHPLRDHWFWRDWRPSQAAYYRLTGDPAWRAYSIDYARDRGGHNYAGWAGQGQVEPNALGWALTGDRYFLRRLAHQLDAVRQAVYEGEPEFFRGWVRGGPMFTSWYLYDFPLALAAFAQAGGEPAPIPNRFWEEGSVETIDGGFRQRWPWIAFEKPAGSEVPLNLTVFDDGRLRYRLYGPAGRLAMQGEWDAEYPKGLASARPTRDRIDVTVPADAPAGVYWLEVTLDVADRRPGRLYLPVTPPAVPEVWLRSNLDFARVGFGEGEWSQYWFRMPDEKEVFEADFRVMGRSPVRRFSIWDADGRRVWDHNQRLADFEEGTAIPARVNVPQDQRGRLWRVTVPGRDNGFAIRSDVRPVFAVAADRWFDPGLPPAP